MVFLYQSSHAWTSLSPWMHHCKYNYNVSAHGLKAIVLIIDVKPPPIVLQWSDVCEINILCMLKLMLLHSWPTVSRSSSDPWCHISCVLLLTRLECIHSWHQKACRPLAGPACSKTQWSCLSPLISDHKPINILMLGWIKLHLQNC